MVWCFGAMWSSALGLTSISLDESCAGGDDEGEWGEKCCTWWDEWDVDVELDVEFGFLLRSASKISGSFWNLTVLFCFGLGSWKESRSSHLVRFLFLAFGGSWNDDPSWHRGFKWAWFLLYFLLFGPAMMLEHPHSKISFTVPVNHFNFAPVLFLWEESNLFFHF